MNETRQATDTKPTKSRFIFPSPFTISPCAKEAIYHRLERCSSEFRALLTTTEMSPLLGRIGPKDTRLRPFKKEPKNFFCALKNRTPWISIFTTPRMYAIDP